jgi:hypothetical protein
MHAKEIQAVPWWQNLELDPFWWALSAGARAALKQSIPEFTQGIKYDKIKLYIVHALQSP